LKLLFARAAQLYCRECDQPVRRDSAESIRAALEAHARDAGDPRLVLTFPITVPENFTETEIKALLAAQGYTRIHAQRGATLNVIQDRFRWSSVDPARAGDAIEAALKVGQGRLDVYVQPDEDAPGPTAPWRFSSGLHCAHCDISYRDPTRARSASTRRSGRAKPAAASAASSVSTSVSSFPTRRCR